MKKNLQRYTAALLICLLGLSSCKKDHDCQCTNPNGSYLAGTIKDTKMRAKKQCEALSSGDTKCDLK